MNSKIKMMLLVLFILFLSARLRGQTNAKKEVFQVVKNYDFMSISPTKMNVLYVGVENPIDLVVMGYSDEMLEIKMDSNATIEKQGKCQYIIKVRKAGLAVIQVYKKGVKPVLIGERIFRVKRVPDPVPYIGGVRGGVVNKAVLLASGAIIPRLENFDFDLNFKVVSFTFTASVGGDLIEKQATGNLLSPEMLKILQASGKGQRIWIENISAQGPDGTTRTLSPINLKLM